MRRPVRMSGSGASARSRGSSAPIVPTADFRPSPTRSFDGICRARTPRGRHSSPAFTRCFSTKRASSWLSTSTRSAGRPTRSRSWTPVCGFSFQPRWNARALAVPPAREVHRRHFSSGDWRRLPNEGAVQPQRRTPDPVRWHRQPRSRSALPRCTTRRGIGRRPAPRRPGRLSP